MRSLYANPKAILPKGSPSSRVRDVSVAYARRRRECYPAYARDSRVSPLVIDLLLLTGLIGLRVLSRVSCPVPVIEAMGLGHLGRLLILLLRLGLRHLARRWPGLHLALRLNGRSELSESGRSEKQDCEDYHSRFHRSSFSCLR